MWLTHASRLCVCFELCEVHHSISPKVMIETFIAAECQGAEPLPQCEEMQRKLREINAFVSRAQPVDAVCCPHIHTHSLLSFSLCGCTVSPCLRVCVVSLCPSFLFAFAFGIF